ncbi:aspartate:alanine antiporter [Parendozoicomonas haliclonae]|uniref:aspartate:alanine antiporter n=1 Tax=Parendozoicomonas haliclonae TaxID=1960125 RepID=UPI000B35CACA
MTINLLSLLKQSPEMLIFLILGIGLLIGKLSIGSFKPGATIGVLITALFFGEMGFTLPGGIESIGFMLFIFCVGIEAGPHFFSAFLRDGKYYVALSLFLTACAVLLSVLLSRIFGFDKGLTAGLLAGSLTSTPALVGAQEALRNLFAGDSAQLSTMQDNLGVGYALTYLFGLIGLMVVVRYLPSIARVDLVDEAKTIARERGIDDSENQKVYLPITRAYRVSKELVEAFEEQNLREIGIYRRTGCYIGKIRRRGILAVPTGDAVLQEGDEIALIGYPDSHAMLDPLFREGSEVFDRDLLDLQLVTEDIVLKNDHYVGKHLTELNLTEKGIFLNRITRSQIEMPVDRDIILNKGDVLRVSGEKRRVSDEANRFGFISIHSKVTDLVAFSAFLILGLFIGKIAFQINTFQYLIGNATGLLISGIMMGYVRAMHPTIGHIPDAALRLLKDMGLQVFMVGIGLKAGQGIFSHLSAIGPVMIFSGLLVGTVPVVLSYVFGRFVLKMNPALLLGAITGARTCAPAMETVNDLSNSNIPSLGYVGTYALANVLFTFAGSIIVGVF